MTKSLKDKVLLITGASSGIGEAVAFDAARAGMHLVLGARRVERLEEVALKARGFGVRVVTLRCDVDHDADVKNLVEAGLKEFGRLDVVFANAGYGFYESVLETSDAKARAMFETNYWGTIRVVKEVGPLLIKQGNGHIIICSSAASEMTPPYFGHYGATKAAQDALAGALRAELAPLGVHVTSVHPIETRTEFVKVAEDNSAQPPKTHNTPAMLVQTREHVSRCIIKAMKKSSPPPEVWPAWFMPYLMAIMTLFPRFAAFSLRQHERELRKARSVG
jgi:short-subunit dehydrogenase